MLFSDTILKNMKTKDHYTINDIRTALKLPPLVHGGNVPFNDMIKNRKKLYKSKRYEYMKSSYSWFFGRQSYYSTDRIFTVYLYDFFSILSICQLGEKYDTIFTNYSGYYHSDIYGWGGGTFRAEITILNQVEPNILSYMDAESAAKAIYDCNKRKGK